MPQLILIAAMAKNRVIGRDGRIPWHIPEEQQRFKAITMGHTLLMGRRTYESIGRPLPGRRTIVISRQHDYAAPGCRVAASLGEALSLCAQEEKVFIAGGGGLYQEALPLADALILSVLDREMAGDVFFPAFEPSHFRQIAAERVEGHEPYTFTVFQRLR